MSEKIDQVMDDDLMTRQKGKRNNICRLILIGIGLQVTSMILSSISVFSEYLTSNKYVLYIVYK